MKKQKGGVMFKRVKLLFLGVFTLSLVFAPQGVAFASPITKANIVEYTNQERVKAGLPILWSNYKLNLAAQNKANDMIANGYWEHYHNGKSPWDWMHEAGYEFKAAGENLAIDFLEVEPMIKAWMNSPTHRQNILNPNFKEIGVGVAKGFFKNHETIIVVQMFGAPKKAIQVESQVAGINEQETKSNESITSTSPAEKQAENKGFWSTLVEGIKNFLFWLRSRLFSFSPFSS